MLHNQEQVRKKKLQSKTKLIRFSAIDIKPCLKV